MRKLTIGMSTHEDFDGLYFSIQNIRMMHPECMDDVEFVIIDNSPNSEHGKSIRKFIGWIEEPVQYFPFTKYESTAIRNKIFDLADTPYVLCIDSHILLEQGSIKKLIDFYDAGKDEGNLLQGPLLHDNLKAASTHFDLSKWGSHMWGQWGNDPRGNDKNGEPFEIEAQGLGLFSCRRNSWLGFNKLFRGFGGEEGYIHEKYRKYGKKTLCLPFLRWIHRFEKPTGRTYPNTMVGRFRNYYIGFTELGLDKTNLIINFKDVATPEMIMDIVQEIKEYHDLIHGTHHASSSQTVPLCTFQSPEV